MALNSSEAEVSQRFLAVDGNQFRYKTAIDPKKFGFLAMSPGAKVVCHITRVKLALARQVDLWLFFNASNGYY